MRIGRDEPYGPPSRVVAPCLGEDLGSLFDGQGGLGQPAADGAWGQRSTAGGSRGWVRRYLGRGEHDGRVKRQEPDAQHTGQDRRLDENSVRQAFPAIGKRRQRERSRGSGCPGDDAS